MISIYVSIELVWSVYVSIELVWSVYVSIELVWSVYVSLLNNSVSILISIFILIK
jgi:hypothetical protein